MPKHREFHDYYVGVELGGTLIRSGVFSPDMDCLGEAKISAKTYRGETAIIHRLARCARDAVDEADLSFSQVRALGVASIGAVDPVNGRAWLSPGPQPLRLPLKSALEESLGVPVAVEESGNAATLASHLLEFDVRPKRLLGIFVGYGASVGLVEAGEICRPQGSNAAWSHRVIDPQGPPCFCGQAGCLDVLSSRRGIIQRLKSAVSAGATTCLVASPLKDLAEIRNGDLRRALKRGDPLARAVMEEAAVNIGRAVAQLSASLTPESVVLGGGIVEALTEPLLELIGKSVRESEPHRATTGPEIVVSQLGDSAAVAGAAILARRLTQPDRA